MIFFVRPSIVIGRDCTQLFVADIGGRVLNRSVYRMVVVVLEEKVDDIRLIVL